MECNAIYDIELVDCEQTTKFIYHCIFCEHILLEYNGKKEFLPKSILRFPIPQIALPGLIYSSLNNFINKYKEYFKEISIKKGQATSSLDISFDEDYDDKFVQLNGWSYIQLEGMTFNNLEKKSIEDFFKRPGIVLRIYFLHDGKEVQIPNIMIPSSLSHKGIGKKMISIIYDACKLFGYRLYIVQMVESFYNKLLKRGAVKIDEDSVEITDDTKLD